MKAKTKRARAWAAVCRFDVEQIVAKYGVRVKRLAATTSLNDRQQASGRWAKLQVVLDDCEPGWRAKDEDNKRWHLKRELRKLMQQITKMNWAVELQANYTCFSVNECGAIERRDNEGHIIGYYIAA